MPPIPKITKEIILDKAFDIVCKEGMESLNVRKLANELNCSTQPILYYYKSMEELKNDVINKCYDLYKNNIFQNTDNDNSYFNVGLNYINFAKEYPIPFKLLFMNDFNYDINKLFNLDPTTDEIIETGTKFTGFSFEEQKEFHKEVWIITHGIATLVATKTVNFTDEEIKQLLGDTVKKLVIGYKVEKGELK